MQLINKFNKGFRFSLCVIDISRKYAWIVPLKDKKDTSLVNAFEKILNDFNNKKPNKIWVDKGSEFYNRPMKSWLDENGIEMCSTHNLIHILILIKKLIIKSLNLRLVII